MGAPQLALAEGHGEGHLLLPLLLEEDGGNVPLAADHLPPAKGPVGHRGPGIKQGQVRQRGRGRFPAPLGAGRHRLAQTAGFVGKQVPGKGGAQVRPAEPEEEEKEAE